MNLQIIGEKSIKKVIAVADDILEQDENEMTLTALRQIIAHCGLEDRYRVEPTAALPQLSERWIPYILVTETGACRGRLPTVFPICVQNYCCTEKEGGCHCTTFSMEDPTTDFVAANVRQFADMDYAFDLMGLGIIGRVHLAKDDRRLLRTALIAASAALSCGISFADVVEVLNTLPVLHPSCCSAH